MFIFRKKHVSKSECTLEDFPYTALRKNGNISIICSSLPSLKCYCEAGIGTETGCGSEFPPVTWRPSSVVYGSVALTVIGGIPGNEMGVVTGIPGILGDGCGKPVTSRGTCDTESSLKNWS